MFISDNVGVKLEDKRNAGLKQRKISGDSQRVNSKHIVCLYPPHREKGRKHYLKDCKVCPEEKKPRLLQTYLTEKKPVVKKAARAKGLGEKQEPMKTQSSILVTTVS